MFPRVQRYHIKTQAKIVGIHVDIVEIVDMVIGYQHRLNTYIFVVLVHLTLYCYRWSKQAWRVRNIVKFRLFIIFLVGVWNFMFLVQIGNDLTLKRNISISKDEFECSFKLNIQVVYLFPFLPVLFHFNIVEKMGRGALLLHLILNKNIYE